MPQYRIEISPNNRAGCKDSQCKKDAVKISKGQIRFGTWIEIQEHGSWGWKHWGCVSGAQVKSLQELCKADGEDYDLDAIDGFDELADAEIKKKIRRVVTQGHIDPEDFNGDPEKNKPGEKGIYLTAKQKQAKAAAEDGSDDAQPPKKKRGRKADAEDAEPATKKPRGKAKAPKEEDEEEVGKEGEEEEVPAPRAKRGPKKATTKAAVKAEEDEGVGEAAQEQIPAAPARRGRKAAPKTAAEEPVPAAKPATRRGRKAAPVFEDAEEEAEEPPVKAKRGRGRKST